MEDKQKRRIIAEEMLPEDSTFVPEIEQDPLTGEMIDSDTRRKHIKPFKQKEYRPLNDYEG